MRTLEKRLKADRREFLGSCAGAALIAGIAGGIDGARALAATLQTVSSAEAAATLLRMARDLYPHDRLPDAAYEKALAGIDAGLAGDAARKTLLVDGVAALDAAALGLKGARYAAIAAETDRVAVLQTIETTPFFATLRGGLITALYDQHDLWVLFGYEGASAEHGGYINRGFDDLDWLPA